MDDIKTTIKKKTQQILEYTNIIKILNSDIYDLKKQLIESCEHTFEHEIVTSGPYREYGYVCTKCETTTSHIV